MSYRLHDTHGSTIVAAIAMMLILSILGAGVASLFAADRDVSLESANSLRALYAAESGIQYVIEEVLPGDLDWSNQTTVTRAFAGGQFQVQFLSGTADSVVLQSTGDWGASERQIRQRTDRVITPPGPPDAYQYAIHAGTTINLQNTLGTIHGDINAGTTVHEGDVTVTGTITTDPTISLPTINWAGFYQAADASQRVAGNYTFKAGQSYTGLWYVDGDAIFQDGATVDGGVVATGKVRANGTDGVTVRSAGGWPAIVSGGNFLANGSTNAYFEGLVYAAANLNDAISNDASGVTIVGILLVGNTFNMNDGDGFTVIYDGSILTNPPPYIGVAGPVSQNEWREVF